MLYQAGNLCGKFHAEPPGGSIFRVIPKTPSMKGELMNTNPKEKTLRIDLRVRPQDKQKIQRLAKRCGLSVSEYVLKRALGYEPRAAPPDALFQFYRKLCDACNMLCEGYPQAETALVSLAAQIQKELILPGKEVTTWRQPASGPSKTD